MYARKLWYGANDGDDGHCFAALLELRRRKNGATCGFVLYYYAVYDRTRYPKGKVEHVRKMLHLPDGKDHREVLRRFGPNGTEFYGWHGDQWERTTDWGYRVGVGGGYELFERGTWVKVGTPNLWKSRRQARKKRRLRVVPITSAYVLRMLERELESRREQLSSVQQEVWDLEHNQHEDDYPLSGELLDELEEAETEMAALKDDVEVLETSILNRKDEFRFVASRALGKSYWPRGQDRLVIRPKAAE